MRTFSRAEWRCQRDTLKHLDEFGLAARKDVAELAGSFGSSTSGTFSLRPDLPALGIAAGEDIGSLHVAE